jgi:hypothetical protein
VPERSRVEDNPGTGSSSTSSIDDGQSYGGGFRTKMPGNGNGGENGNGNNPVDSCSECGEGEVCCKNPNSGKISCRSSCSGGTVPIPLGGLEWLLAAGVGYAMLRLSGKSSLPIFLKMA